MNAKRNIALLLGVLMIVSVLVGPVSAEPEKKQADWREDYAYTLGVQAYIFSYPWVFLPHIRYAWVVGNEANNLVGSGPEATPSQQNGTYRPGIPLFDR